MKKPGSYLVNGLLACAVLYFALSLSRSGRGAVDWAVISLVGLAILWNVVNLGRRLYRAGGGRDLWHLQRTLLFWILGIFNTALIRPEEAGSWKNILGWILVVVAAADTVVLYRKERAATKPPADAPAA